MNIKKNSIYNYILDFFRERPVQTKTEKIANKIARRREIDMKKVELCYKPCRYYNDTKAIINKVSPKARKIVASLPKGSFKRVSKEYVEPITGKRHIIAYEGIKVNYDVTTEGNELPKIRGYLK